MSWTRLAALLAAATVSLAANPPAKSPREALQPFNSLIGVWKGTGTPEGTPDERQKGHWVENMTWTWQFKGDDAWLAVTIENGKHYTGGELRYVPAKNVYEMTLTTPDKKTAVFAGTLKDKLFTLDRTDPDTKDGQRLVFSLLHHNRFLYRFETKPAAGASFAKRYSVGVTKQGEAFATLNKGPECIVSGGAAAMKVTYKGVDYFVCCTGCRDAFKDDPEKFIKEAAAKAKK